MRRNTTSAPKAAAARIVPALAALAIGLGTAAGPCTAAPGVAPVGTRSPATAITDPPSCHPSRTHPRPVVLLHGTMDDATAWQVLAPRLTESGYCVYAPTYGFGAIVPAGGLAPVARSAVEVSEYMDRVLAVTGADRVDIVGHSQGGTIAEYVAKNLGRASLVHKEILLAPVTHGTDLMGLVDLSSQVPPLRTAVDSAVLPLVCAACADLETDSRFVQELTAGPIAQPGVRYSVLATHDDTTSTPAGSASFIEEPGVTNLFVQDLRPGSVTHKGLPADAAVIDWIAARLDSDS
ncbi:esterase/lipase family protein [Nocardia jejuensis]|uniref:esterase/lipase family protein n=1 Tax=Nocardia jejuensis TaxID=328049 RepID=UPI0008304E7C|nr:alpha/beta fold hydrolase [Nocardia jejuensis]